MDNFTTFAAVAAVVLVVAGAVAATLIFGGYGLMLAAFLAVGVLLPSYDPDGKTDNITE